MSGYAIKAENISKQYWLGNVSSGYRTLRESIMEALQKPFHILRDRNTSDRESIWALRDLSFEIASGQVVGIIGRNGAGKSTLLKILARITRPTRGRALIRGRVGSLLEVGTGFHGELTGRENIYLNGAILGMRRREIERKFDEIVSFAEIDCFLDTPVKRYSSGMYMRLAFAVAAHLEPEILLVDEVLAVGDHAFQKKCLGKMSEVAYGGRTVLFVSHNMGAINQLCPRSIWLHRGQLMDEDESDKIIEKYLASNYQGSANIQFEPRSGKKAQFLSVRLMDDAGREASEFPGGASPRVEVIFEIYQAVTGAHVACIVFSSNGTHLFSTADNDLDPSRLDTRKPGRYTARVTLPISAFNVGTYHLAVGIGIPGMEVFDRQEALTFSIVDTGDFGTMKEGGRRQGLLLVQAPWAYE
jgi:lipopolysaccharide transport system ATP-binding protein